MIIRSAEFVCSNNQIDKLPPEKLPEYAFIGRSNVGKSSLINMLTRHKGLARISQNPGKTQLINHFLINQEWYLVDLPGYGYARTSKTNRKSWAAFIKQYLEKRGTLQAVMVLIDSRLKPQQNDLEFINWLGERGIPFVLVFTKTDKLSKQKTVQHIQDFKKEMLKTWEEIPDLFITSAENKTGREEILDFIDKVNEKFEVK